MSYWIQKPPLGVPIDWSHPLSKYLVGCWPFNEDGGDTVEDLSLNNNPGTFVNAVTWGSGQFGPALYFGGVNTSVNIPYNSSLAFSGNDPISISVWINPSNTQSSAGDARPFTQANEILLRFGTDVDDIEFILNSFSSNDRISSGAGTIIPDAWNHVAGTYNGSDLKIYVNGIEKGSVSPTGTYGGSTSDFEIGAYDTSFELTGFIDIPCIWRRGLTAFDVTQLYETPFIMFQSLDLAMWYAPAVVAANPYYYQQLVNRRYAA